MRILSLAAVLSFALIACKDEPPPPPPPATKPTPASTPAVAEKAPASAPAAPKTVTSGPRVIQVDGDATVDGEKAVVGTPVKMDSVIETKADAKLVFTLGPGSITQVRANGKVELGKSERKEISLKLIAGAVWSFLPKGKASYEVVASNVVAGVRGTIFFVKNTDEANAYVCDCDGEVETLVNNKKKGLKSKMQHLGVSVSGAGAKAKQKGEKKPIDHTKDEAMALEKLRATIE